MVIPIHVQARFLAPLELRPGPPGIDAGGGGERHLPRSLKTPVWCWMMSDSLSSSFQLQVKQRGGCEEKGRRRLPEATLSKRGPCRMRTIERCGERGRGSKGSQDERRQTGALLGMKERWEAPSAVFLSPIGNRPRRRHGLLAARGSQCLRCRDSERLCNL